MFYERSKRKLPRDGTNDLLRGGLHTYEWPSGGRYVCLFR